MTRETSAGLIEREELTVEFLTAMYEAGYELEDALGDVEPGYEYAIQQLCSKMKGQGHLNDNMESRAMNAAQERVFGEPKTDPSMSLSEFGVVPDE